jgi:hypothetical protein
MINMTRSKRLSHAQRVLLVDDAVDPQNRRQTHPSS